MTAVEKVANAVNIGGYQNASSAAVTEAVEAASAPEKKREIVSKEEGSSFAGTSADNQGNSAKLQSKGDSKTANEEIRKKVDQINKEMLEQNSEAIFGIHDETNRVTIKIVDKNSKKVLKEFPPEKTLDMLAKLWEVAGIMVDEKR